MNAYLKATVVQLTNKKFYGRLVVDFRAGNVYQLKTEQVETMDDIRANLQNTILGK